MHRASEVVATFGFLLEILLVMTFAVFLSGKLKKVDDMFNMSWEILFFGGCALLSLGKPAWNRCRLGRQTVVTAAKI